MGVNATHCNSLIPAVAPRKSCVVLRLLTGMAAVMFSMQDLKPFHVSASLFRSTSICAIGLPVGTLEVDAADLHIFVFTLYIFFFC